MRPTPNCQVFCQTIDLTLNGRLFEQFSRQCPLFGPVVSTRASQAEVGSFKTLAGLKIFEFSMAQCSCFRDTRFEHKGTQFENFMVEASITLFLQVIENFKLRPFHNFLQCDLTFLVSTCA